MLRDYPTIHIRGAHDCFGGLSNIFASEGSPMFLPKLGSVFSRTKKKAFVLKTDYFTRIRLRHM